MIYYHKNSKDWYETWVWPKEDIQIYVETVGQFVVDEWNYEYLVTNFDYEEERFIQATDHQLETLIKMLFRPNWKVEDQRSIPTQWSKK